MEPNKTHSNRDAVQKELEAISPMLANIGKPAVPMPNDAYFAKLASEIILEAPAKQQPKRTFKLIPWGIASLAAAASIAIALIFWPTDSINTYNSVAFDSLSNDDLIQLAMQEEGILDERMMEDDSLLVTLAANTDFQYMEAPGENDEYNKLLWELVDDETLMEDWL